MGWKISCWMFTLTRILIHKSGIPMKSLLLSASVLALTLGASTVSAHHGFGRFDRANDSVFTGTITGIDFVNPHAYLYFDSMDTGELVAMRCEMRAATLLRRSGWTQEMFVTGAPVTIYGFKHRTDPGSCYLEDITIGDAQELNRNDQLDMSAVDVSDRPMRLPNGAPNISGDWAQEQYVVARPADGARIGLVPKSMKAGIEDGSLGYDNIPDAGWGPPPVALTARGQREADAFEQWSVEDNPRLRCEPTSIIFDWVHDGPVNRVTQMEDRIVINYGLYSNERIVYMNMDEHPAMIEPTFHGHSIGHWDGDVLVVDTVGFKPGVIAPPVRHSDQLHVIERFRLEQNPLRLVREYEATDPVYFAEPYARSDELLVADVEYVKHDCDELTFEFLEFQNQ